MLDGRRVRSGETWAAAREAYLAGLSAGEVCERFDLGLSALRARARREGWRRADQTDPDPALEEDLDEELEADGPADFAAMANRAARLAQRAVLRGEAAAADAWMRLYIKLRHHVRADALEPNSVRQPPIPAPPPEPAEAHSVHLVHPDSECIPPPSPARPRNRADRRRQARLAALQDRKPARAEAEQGP